MSFNKYIIEQNEADTKDMKASEPYIPKITEYGDFDFDTSEDETFDSFQTEAIHTFLTK